MKRANKTLRKQKQRRQRSRRSLRRRLTRRYKHRGGEYGVPILMTKEAAEKEQERGSLED
jgi:hypothetical protein